MRLGQAAFGDNGDGRKAMIALYSRIKLTIVRDCSPSWYDAVEQ
jgi:hypothetical protein